MGPGVYMALKALLGTFSSVKYLCYQMDDDDDDSIIEQERSQKAAQFGWFNDLYMFDTGKNIHFFYCVLSQSVSDHFLRSCGIVTCSMPK